LGELAVLEVASAGLDGVEVKLGDADGFATDVD